MWAQVEAGRIVATGTEPLCATEMHMCGARADQIYRLVGSGGDISIVEHAHQISGFVRGTLRSMTVLPGSPRKFCVIDGQTTYRIFKAYGLLG